MDDFRALDPFSRVIEQGLAGFVDGGKRSAVFTGGMGPPSRGELDIFAVDLDAGNAVIPLEYAGGYETGRVR